MSGVITFSFTEEEIKELFHEASEKLDYQKALQYGLMLVEAAKKRGDVAGQIEYLNSTLVFYRKQGLIEEGDKACLEALELIEAHRHELGAQAYPLQAEILQWQIDLHLAAADQEAVVDIAEQLLELAHQQQDKHFEAVALFHLGLVCKQNWEKERAIHYLQQVLQLKEHDEDEKDPLVSLSLMLLEQLLPQTEDQQ